MLIRIARLDDAIPTSPSAPAAVVRMATAACLSGAVIIKYSFTVQINPEVFFLVIDLFYAIVVDMILLMCRWHILSTRCVCSHFLFSARLY